MGGWGAPVPGGAADGACVCCRRRKKTIATTAMEIATTPPTTPPTMAPVFELLPPVAVGLDRVEGKLLTVIDNAELVCGVADAATVTPEGPSTAPGGTSGVSIEQDVGEALR